MKSPTSIVKMLKSITVREIFQRYPEVKKILWGGVFRSIGYFVNTVSKFGNESTISKYVRDQGMDKEYDVLHEKDQMRLFRFFFGYIVCLHRGSSFSYLSEKYVN